MDNTIGEAYLQIKPSMRGVTDEITQQLSGAGKSGAGAFGSAFSSSLGKAGAVGAAAIGAATAATSALVGGLVSATTQTAEYGDNIDKMSQKMGMSAEAYQEWDAVMQHSGTSMETLKASMKTMATAVDSGSDAFTRLGISEEEVANLSQEDLFSKVITGLQEMGEGTERTYIAGQLLGRGATELGALLNTSAEDTQAMKDRVHELGGVMSDEAVKAAAGFQDSLQDLQTSAQGITRNLTTEFLPSVTSVMDGLTNIFAGDTDLGLSQISEGINTFINEITLQFPKLLEIGMGIVTALGDAIIANLPALASAALTAVGQLGGFILENLPLLVDTALSIIMTIADGLIANLPALIPAVVDILLTIVDKLTQPDMIEQLINVALQLILALTEGLMRALPQLVARVPEIVFNIVKGIVSALPEIFAVAVQLIGELISGITSCWANVLQIGSDIIEKVKDGVKQKIEDAKNWGRDLIANFVSGIKDKLGALKDGVSGIGDAIKERLHFSEPDVGPLADFHTYAPDMMKLFVSGITDNISMVKNAVGSVAESVSQGMQIGVVSNGTTYTPADTLNAQTAQLQLAGGGSGDICIPVYIGNEKIDELIVRANQRANYRSGGR